MWKKLGECCNISFISIWIVVVVTRSSADRLRFEFNRHDLPGFRAEKSLHCTGRSSLLLPTKCLEADFAEQVAIDQNAGSVWRTQKRDRTHPCICLGSFLQGF